MLVRIAGISLLGIAASGFIPSHAQDGFGGALTLVSDYVYRGISQTRGEPALQADFHYASLQGWSLGVWGSTVELNGWEGRTAELNAYAGYRWQWNRDWSTKVSAVHYQYPWNDNGARYDYNEIVGSIDFRNNLFATIAWSLDTTRYAMNGYASRGDAVSYELATAFPLMNALTANVGIGYYDLRNLVDSGYLYWNTGVSYDWRLWHMNISYIGTNNEAERLTYGNVAGDRVTATLSWRF